MNWGFKILLTYLCFVTLIVVMVSLSMREKVDLVSPDYYAKELKYQERIDWINNTNKLSKAPEWIVTNDSLLISFPKKEKISASVYLFRPSDSNLDTSFKFFGFTEILGFSTKKIKSGSYKCELTWDWNNEKYYHEGYINIK